MSLAVGFRSGILGEIAVPACFAAKIKVLAAVVQANARAPGKIRFADGILYQNVVHLSLRGFSTPRRVRVAPFD